MAAAVLFGAASCVKEDISSSLSKGEVEVAFTVNMADLGTRAIGDASNVDVVYLGVYEQNSTTPLTGLVEADGYDVINGVANFSVVLLKDKYYDLVFWAQDKDVTCYEMKWGDRQLVVDYTTVASQDENRDAFFLVDNGFHAGHDETVFHLHRPFAQLNAGLSAEDVTNISNNGVVVENLQSKVVVKNVATKLNLLTEADDVATDVEEFEEVTFEMAAKPAATEVLKVNNVNYTYLSMNYLLVDGKQNVDVTYYIAENGVNEDPYVRHYYNVPVQRNYRTNIIGNLISSPMDFTVYIVPGFNDPDYVVEGYQVEVDENGNTTATVDSAEGLLAIAQEIEEGNIPLNATIELSEDIDLSAISRSLVSNWTPIGTSEKPFTGTFNGRGRSIKNLVLVEEEAKEGKAYIGFFGYAKNATIKNVTFENVYVKIPCLDIDHSQGHIGAVVGSLEGKSSIENVTVKGDIKVYATQDANGASRVGVVAGGNSYGDITIKNVHVIASEGSYLKANNNTGAIAGQLQGKTVYENCSSNIDVTVNKFFAGGIVGLAGTNDTFTNCHTTGNIAVVAGREGRANDHYRVGGIAGGWADGKNNTCTLINCSYTGEISGVNADGSVAEPLDYFGYVGRGYTLANCEGSKVIIDGVEIVQVGNAAPYGKYTINGLTSVSTAEELVAALEANKGVYFLKDIKIEPANMSNAYGATGINVKNGQTIDGGGHTLNIKGAGGTWDSGINTTGGLIKNLTVTGSFRGIFINHTSTYSEKVVLENVTIGGNGTVYTISCDQGLYQTIEATNCTFNGWTSFAKTAGEAKFVKCEFGEGSGYKYCRPYSNTEFVECTFCPGYAVDTTRATVTFTDCTWEE